MVRLTAVFRGYRHWGGLTGYPGVAVLGRSGW